MDLSFSMEDDLMNVKKLGADLMKEMKNITSDFRLGLFASVSLWNLGQCNFLITFYICIFIYLFFLIPLCPIYIVIHLGAAQYNHNLTTDHWAALLEWLGIRCFAQGQLVAFGRQETISYLTSPPPPPQPFFFSFTSHSTQYFLFSFVPFHFHFQKVLLHLWERQWFYTSTLQRTCSEIPVKGLSPGPAPLPSPTTTS